MKHKFYFLFFMATLVAGTNTVLGMEVSKGIMVIDNLGSPDEIDPYDLGSSHSKLYDWAGRKLGRDPVSFFKEHGKHVVGKGLEVGAINVVGTLASAGGLWSAQYAWNEVNCFVPNTYSYYFPSKRKRLVAKKSYPAEVTNLINTMNVETAKRKTGFQNLIYASQALGEMVTSKPTRWNQILKDRYEIPENDSAMPRGAIFAGLPGTGKTLVAEEFARKTNSKYVYYDMTKIVTKRLVGSGVEALDETIENVNNIARSIYPRNCVVMYDEADALGTRDEEKNFNYEVITRFLSALNINGQDSPDEILVSRPFEKNVFVIMATNYLEKIDKGFRLRRLEPVPFGLPEASVRLKILQQRVKSRQLYASAYGYLKTIADQAVGFTPAELEQVIAQASRHFEIDKWNKGISYYDATKNDEEKKDKEKEELGEGKQPVEFISYDLKAITQHHLKFAFQGLIRNKILGLDIEIGKLEKSLGKDNALDEKLKESIEELNKTKRALNDNLDALNVGKPDIDNLDNEGLKGPEPTPWYKQLLRYSLSTARRVATSRSSYFMLGVVGTYLYVKYPERVEAKFETLGNLVTRLPFIGRYIR